MLSFDPYDLPLAKRHQFIVGSVGPRPIAWASTINENGQSNLAPYSFFNAFSANPPILVFSSNRRGKDNTTKHTLHNIMANKEVVINVVTEEVMHQMSITSTDYDESVNEFEKAGVTMVESEIVKPFRVGESKVQFECKVNDIIHLGEEGGAGNLFICEIVKMHISETVLDENEMIDPQKLRQVGRLGRYYYTKAYGESVVEVNNPFDVKNLGFDALPESIKGSEVLSGNDIAKIAMLTDFPSNALIESVQNDPEATEILDDYTARHHLAQEWLDKGRVEEAFALLLV